MPRSTLYSWYTSTMARVGYRGKLELLGPFWVGLVVGLPRPDSARKMVGDPHRVLIPPGRARGGVRRGGSGVG